MNRSYRRKLEKLREQEYRLFVKKNKGFLDAIKGDGGSQETMQRIKELLDNYGQQEQTLEGRKEIITTEEERTEVEGNQESSRQDEVGS
jgi:phosphopantothenoylcysteine synthetase/decarboxylase